MQNHSCIFGHYGKYFTFLLLSFFKCHLRFMPTSGNSWVCYVYHRIEMIRFQYSGENTLDKGMERLWKWRWQYVNEEFLIHCQHFFLVWNLFNTPQQQWRQYKNRIESYNPSFKFWFLQGTSWFCISIVQMNMILCCEEMSNWVGTLVDIKQNPKWCPYFKMVASSSIYVGNTSLLKGLYDRNTNTFLIRPN